MRTVRDIDIDIPPHVGAWLDAAAAHPAVRSVILYGSRSIGRHRENSDWDIALVTDQGEQPVALMEDQWKMSAKHGIAVLSESDFLASRDVYASLPSEVALGVVLRGRDYPFEEEHMARKRLVGSSTQEARSTYIGLTEHLWKFLQEDIQNVSNCKQSEYTRAVVGLGGASADAAERAVKLVTLSLGLPFQATHDLRTLAQDLPREWRERVEALNGDTDVLHQANYGERMLEQDEIRDVCEQTERRLHLTLDVVALLPKMATPLRKADCKDLLRHMTETDPYIRTMRELCADVVPDLLAKFVATRDECMERFLRDSAGPGPERA